MTTSPAKSEYCKTLTSEIFATIDNIIDDSTDEKMFIEAQERVQRIIEREYVDVCKESAIRYMNMRIEHLESLKPDGYVTTALEELKRIQKMLKKD